MKVRSGHMVLNNLKEILERLMEGKQMEGEGGDF